MSAEDLECTVCLEPFDVGLRAPMIIPCGGSHELCFSCVTMLRKDSGFQCPSCRAQVAPEAQINRNRGLLAALEALAQQPSKRRQQESSNGPVDERQVAQQPTSAPTPEPTLERQRAAVQAPPGLACTSCHQMLPKSAFSKAQLKKKSTVEIRCTECVGAEANRQATPASPSTKSPLLRASAAELDVGTAEAPRRRAKTTDLAFEDHLARARSLDLITEAEVDRMIDQIAQGLLTESTAATRLLGLLLTARHAAFAGKRVRVHGLSLRAELNGRIGRVTGFMGGGPCSRDGELESISVELEDVSTAGSAERVVCVGSSNLEVVSEEQRAERVPAKITGETMMCTLDANLPELKDDFSSLARACTECGAQPVTLSRCGKCRLVHYCSRACQLAGWNRGGHKRTCGQPLPTPESVRGSSPTQLQRTVAEFGCASAQVATACMMRVCTTHPASTDGQRYAKAFGTAAGVQSIERVMAHFPALPGVQLTALPALMLVGERRGAAVLLGGDAVALTAKALAQDFPATPSGYPAREFVSTNALLLLKNLYMEQNEAQAAVIKRALVAAGGVPAVCRALHDFPKNVRLRDFGLTVLMMTVANDYTAKEQAVAAGAAALCVTALRNDLRRLERPQEELPTRRAPESHALESSGRDLLGSVHAACCALRNLTVGEDAKGVARKRAAVVTGGVYFVCGALCSQAVIEDEENVEAALSALLNMFCDETASSIDRLLPHGIEGLLRMGVLPALNAHPKCEQVQMFGVSALNTYTLFAGEAVKERLCRGAIAASAPAALVRMIYHHSRHEVILNAACSTLCAWYEVLSSGTPRECPLWRAYAEANVLKAVLHAMKSSSTVSSAHEMLTWLLKTHPQGEQTAVAELSKALQAMGPDATWFRESMARLQARVAAGEF
jgi:hypothetical protein